MTSMIVQAGQYTGKASITDEVRISCMPESQYYDICNHFGFDIDDKQMTTTEEEVPPMEKMKLLSSQMVPLIQLISQPLQKLQMPDCRKRTEGVERNRNCAGRRNRCGCGF